MSKLLKDILKQGSVLEVKILDYNDPKLKKQLAKLQKDRDAILACKKVDWEKLAHTYITI